MLLDTSGLLCLLHQPEPFHDRAVEAYRAARGRVTHSYILAELVALANARRLPRQGVLTFLIDLMDNPDVETVWVDESLHRRGIALLQAREDKAYSLADAVSFLLMRERNLLDGLTTDRHFEQEGFRRLLK